MLTQPSTSYIAATLATSHIPASPLLPILSPLLPLLFLLNLYFSSYNVIRHPSGTRNSTDIRNRRRVPPATETVTTAATTAGVRHTLLTVLATLVISLSVPLVSSSSSPVNKCLLNTQWQSFFSSHSLLIEQIQNRFDCCGFNSVKDRSWPFPRGSKPEFSLCEDRFHREISCAGPWGAEMKRVGELALALGILIGLLQVGLPPHFCCYLTPSVYINM